MLSVARNIRRFEEGIIMKSDLPVACDGSGLNSQGQKRSGT